MGEQSMTIMLNGSDLTVTEVVAAARHGEPVALAPGAVETMEQARAVVRGAPDRDAVLRPHHRRRRAQVVPARPGRAPKVQPAPGAEPPHRPGRRGPRRRGPGLVRPSPSRPARWPTRSPTRWPARSRARASRTGPRWRRCRPAAWPT